MLGWNDGNLDVVDLVCYCLATFHRPHEVHAIVDIIAYP